jgi:transposase
VKLHALIDAESKTILAWRLTPPGVHDTLELGNLLTQAGTRLREVYADAGYLSNLNAFRIRASGATPYIRPKIDTRTAPKKSNAFNAMVRSYQADPATWLKTYGKRNRVESVFAALKRRVGGTLRSWAAHALRIEACLKVLAWNLTRAKVA